MLSSVICPFEKEFTQRSRRDKEHEGEEGLLFEVCAWALRQDKGEGVITVKVYTSQNYHKYYHHYLDDYSLEPKK